jgi:uncharacterized protein YdhG (YjbR/CyaY superfamily)
MPHMKTAQTGKVVPKSKDAPRGKGAPKGVEDYLAGVPEAARSSFEKLRAAVLSVVPAEATETISYGIPAIRHGNVVVWYGAFAGHCSLFPTAAVIEDFKSELKGYTTSKGTIQFPVDKPVPVGLIKKIVRVRLAQVKSKKK